jgi:hypothetical protein
MRIDLKFERIGWGLWGTVKSGTHFLQSGVIFWGNKYLHRYLEVSFKKSLGKYYSQDTIVAVRAELTQPLSHAFYHPIIYDIEHQFLDGNPIELVVTYVIVLLLSHNNYFFPAQSGLVLLQKKK